MTGILFLLFLEAKWLKCHQSQLSLLCCVLMGDAHSLPSSALTRRTKYTNLITLVLASVCTFSLLFHSYETKTVLTGTKGDIGSNVVSLLCDY